MTMEQVCLLAKVMGSKVIFENKLKTDLIYHPDQFDKLASENFSPTVM